MMNGFYRDGFFWRKRHPDQKWEERNYKALVDGKGDLIKLTMERIREQKDKSWWAYRSLWNCSELLKERKRWPLYMNQDIDAKNIIQWRWSQLMQRLGVNKTVLYRSRNSITRDPYCYFYATCVHLDRVRLIKAVKPPWYLWRPPLWTWRRYILTGKRKWLYEAVEWVNVNINFHIKRHPLRIRWGLPNFAKRMVILRREIVKLKEDEGANNT